MKVKDAGIKFIKGWFREVEIDVLTINAHRKNRFYPYTAFGKAEELFCKIRCPIPYPKLKSGEGKEFQYLLRFFKTNTKPKHVDLFWGRTDMKPFNFWYMIQFISVRGDAWTRKEIKKILKKLKEYLDFGLWSLSKLELHFDVEKMPTVKECDIVIGQRRAKKTRRSKKYKGFCEGNQGRGRGVLTKFYLKFEKWTRYRIEIVLSKDRLTSVYNCKTIDDVFQLNPFFILKSESQFCVVPKKWWKTIIQNDEKREKKCREIFKKKGAIALRESLSQDEIKTLRKKQYLIPASELFHSEIYVENSSFKVKDKTKYKSTLSYLVPSFFTEDKYLDFVDECRRGT